MALYIVLGVAESSLSLVSAVAGKYAIDIITGYQISRLWVLLVLMVASAVSSLLLRSAVSRISARVSLRVNNDIRAEVFDCILRSRLARTEPILERRPAQPAQQRRGHRRGKRHQLAAGSL